MISARGLSKEFTVKRKVTHAVTDLNIDVERGELVAFLGPNGAGKSTSLRMLTTLLPPTSGQATVAGYDIATGSAAVRSRIGYIGQGNSAGHNHRVRDELLSQGAFYGMSRTATAQRADELIESLGLGGLEKRPVLGLSGGQKRRLDIALGLVHSPELLFLDEPSTGLDPQSRANLWQHILTLRRQHGTTIFVTTHYLEEADQFAERVMVMDSGRMIADDTAPALKTRLAGDVISIGLGSMSEASRAAELVATALPSCRVNRSAHDETVLEITLERGNTELPRLLRHLDAAGVPVRTAALRQPTLDDVFLALTGRSLRDDSAAEPNSSSAEIENTGVRS
ncbi:ATP-binding cassette domain-containing protein [Mycetocola zhadangensis]|uniref:ATP-binding cassette domain-containing protein n=2 Tax=Mycetocola zhadangensis TaxID=1164595 RepID=A0A3L7ITP2_9MICO|nr:ATP-binding cassette domain-containing protein [Mycetocola zhadangensis]